MTQTNICKNGFTCAEDTTYGNHNLTFFRYTLYFRLSQYTVSFPEQSLQCSSSSLRCMCIMTIKYSILLIRLEQRNNYCNPSTATPQFTFWFVYYEMTATYSTFKDDCTHKKATLFIHHSLYCKTIASLPFVYVLNRCLYFQDNVILYIDCVSTYGADTPLLYSICTMCVMKSKICLKRFTYQ